mmetsp:Transcript_15268/g.30845  ORF Transcript_15268/g.30845 Transcript_15268/m.30845 type:complete len:544 (-) Transcript_15268:484-2115(-)
MAAGASSPELFSSIIALFVTHSALGLGTIVGSEIFNQLMICAGSVLASRTGNLTLDRAVVTREVGFYALSIVLLMVALRDTKPLEDDPDGPDHIFIDFYDGLMLFGGYIAYILVCAHFDAVVNLFTPQKDKKRPTLSKEGTDYGTISASKRHVSIDIPQELPFLRAARREPEENFVTPHSKRDLLEAAKSTSEDLSKVSLYMTKDGGQRSSGTSRPESSIGAPLSTQSSVSESNASSIRKNASILVNKVVGVFSEGVSVRLFDLFVDIDKPSDSHDLYDVEKNEFEERLSCFLWQRSLFYNKAKVSMGGWYLRWFSFSHNLVASVPNRKQYDKHTLLYKKFYQIEVDDKRMIIKLVGRSERHRDFYLMAPSRLIYNEVVKKCEELIATWSKQDHTSTSTDVMELSTPGIDIDGYADDEASLIAFPSGGTWCEILIYLVLLPLKLLMHFTVPDVRHLKTNGEPTASLSTAFVAVISCLLWLIVGSYAMVASLEDLAELLDIPDAVMGATFSAAGTSLPNYVASQVAARQGVSRELLISVNNGTR